MSGNGYALAIEIEQIDVPEILSAERDKIKDQLETVLNFKDVDFKDGTYKTVFEYTRIVRKRQPHQIQIKASSWNDYNLYDGCTEQLGTLAKKMEEYLQSWDIEQFKESLVKVHYRVGNIDTAVCVGIPEKLFKWICCHSPMLSLSYLTILWKNAILLILFASFMLSIPAYTYIDSLQDFNNAISKLPVTLALVLVAIRFVHHSAKDEKIEKELILSHLILYRRGYQLFYDVESNSEFINRYWHKFLACFQCCRKGNSAV